MNHLKSSTDSLQSLDSPSVSNKNSQENRVEMRRWEAIAKILKIPRYQLLSVREIENGFSVTIPEGDTFVANEAVESVRWQICEFGCIREDCHGHWWILNHQYKGWSSFGYAFEELTVLEAKQSVRMIEDAHEDKDGTYYEFLKDLFLGW